MWGLVITVLTTWALVIVRIIHPALAFHSGLVLDGAIRIIHILHGTIHIMDMDGDIIHITRTMGMDMVTVADMDMVTVADMVTVTAEVEDTMDTMAVLTTALEVPLQATVVMIWVADTTKQEMEMEVHLQAQD